MKKCPFCAEEIQDEAIKCKHCGSMLNGAAPGVEGDRTPPPEEPKSTLFEGTPSWRAFFGSYALIALLTPALAVGALFAVMRFMQTPTPLWKALAVLIPLAVGGLLMFITTLVRRSTRFRLSNRSVEYEVGVFSKKIDVLELWRIKDLRYRQSLLDRMLGIAHIDIYTKDVTSPQLEIVGIPAARALFEQLRDNIEIQRQSKRVLGIMD